MHPAITSVALLASLTSLAAQTTIVPSAAATTDPKYYSSVYFYSTTAGNESRTLTLYSSADIAQPVLTFQSMEVRRPQFLGNQNIATTGNMHLVLSNSPVAPTAISTTYASNHGTQTTVFNGQINLPARNRGAAWPDPWESPIPFTNTYIYVAQSGGSLAVENTFTQGSTTQPWYVEWHQKEVGIRTTNFSACKAHSDGGANNSISHRNPEVGGQWYVYYNSMPSNVPSLNASFQIIGLGGVGSTEFGMPLPIPLSTLSLPSPGCQLAVTDTVRAPLSYVTSTAGPNRGTLRGPQINIPNTPSLAGVSFFDQAVCIDTNATTNQQEIYMGWSSKWTVGSGTGRPIASVYRISGGVALPTATSTQIYGGPSLRFQ